MNPIFRSSLRTVPACLALLLCLASIAGGADADLRSRLRLAMRAGDLGTAHAVLSELRLNEPDEPIHAYNLACVEARLGHGEQSAATLSEAISLGYDDLRAMQTDPDLAACRETDAFTDLERALTDRLTRINREHARDVPIGAGFGVRTDSYWHFSDARLQVSMTGSGVEIDVTASSRDLDLGGSRSPSRGVQVVLVVPRPEDVFDSSRAWQFAFGLADGSPVGYVRRTPDRVVETRVLELAPEVVEPDRHRRRLKVSIPWSYIFPYAPPTDLRFGLNVGMISGADPEPLAMVPDPALFRGGPGAKRFMPIELSYGTEHIDYDRSFHGRVSDTVVGAVPLDITLTVAAPEAGPGGVAIEILDRNGRTVMPDAVKGSTLRFRQGLTTIERRADLSALPVDDYRLQARAVFADSSTLDWSIPLLRLDGTWLGEARDRIATLHPLDRPTLRHRLSLIEAHLENRDPRTAPTALSVSLSEVVNMQNQADKTGHIFPGGGSVLMVCAEAPAIFATAHLTPDWSGAGDGRLLVLPPFDPARDDALPREILSKHRRRDLMFDLLVLRPLLGGDLYPQDIAAACRDWAAERLPDLVMLAPDMETAPANIPARAEHLLDLLIDQ